MDNRKYRSKVWKGKQRRGAAGLASLALVSLLETQELPQDLAVLLGVGQVVGLLLAVFAAVYCFYAQHNQTRDLQGCGAMCLKCKLPSFHCEICDICVPKYSHHSRWLNNCIGTCNRAAYLTGLISLGTVAGLQAAASVSLHGMMFRSKAFAMHLNEKYSLRDEGYLFHLLIVFALLLSCSVEIACFINGIKEIYRLISLRREKQSVIRLILNTGSKVDLSQAAYRCEEKQPLPDNLQIDSFDSVQESSFRGGKLLKTHQAVKPFNSLQL
jgi:hypothetical protein